MATWVIEEMMTCPCMDNAGMCVEATRCLFKGVPENRLGSDLRQKLHKITAAGIGKL